MDLTIQEIGEGGDLILGNNDLETTNAIYNFVYLAWFGGNVVDGDVDAEERVAGEQRYDYWQNDTFFKNEYKNLKLTSQTELMLSNVALTSQGLYDLEVTATEDLAVLKEIAGITVNVSVDGNNNINLIAKLQQIDSSNIEEYKFVWDATKSELINEITI